MPDFDKSNEKSVTLIITIIKIYRILKNLKGPANFLAGRKINELILI